MNIVFLDIDGVIAPYIRLDEYRTTCHDIVDGGVLMFDPFCVERLNTLCDETNASIVVSSSWRFYLKSLNQMQEMLSAQGITADVVGMTETETGSMERGDEVLAYVESLDDTIDGWVILDDARYDWVGCQDHLVMTDPKTGISDDDVASAIGIMGA